MGERSPCSSRRSHAAAAPVLAVAATHPWSPTPPVVSRARARSSQSSAPTHRAQALIDAAGLDGDARVRSRSREISSTRRSPGFCRLAGTVVLAPARHDRRARTGTATTLDPPAGAVALKERWPCCSFRRRRSRSSTRETCARSLPGAR